MDSDATVPTDAGRTARGTLILRWAVAGLLLPAALAGISWVAYASKLGFIAELMSMPAVFAAPFSPLALAALTTRGAHGPVPYVIAAAVLAGNVAVYALVGMLHARLQRRPIVDQLLWLTLVIGVGFSLLSFVATIVAFG